MRLTSARLDPPGFAPGLGIELDSDVIRRYLVETEIKVRGALLYRTPEL